MTSSIIFLDFDGVIATVRTRFDHLDPVAVRMIDDLLTVSNSELVISSTWRIGSSSGDLRRLLKQAGMREPPFHQCWKTPELKSTTFRGDEVAMWMTQHGTPSKYLILDDDTDFHEYQKPFFVRTCAHNGYLWDHHEQAHKILGVKIK